MIKNMFELYKKIQNQATRHEEKFNRNFRDSEPGVKNGRGNTYQASFKYGEKPSCFGNSLAAASFKDPALWDSKDTARSL